MQSLNFELLLCWTDGLSFSDFFFIYHITNENYKFTLKRQNSQAEFLEMKADNFQSPHLAFFLSDCLNWARDDKNCTKYSRTL